MLTNKFNKTTMPKSPLTKSLNVALQRNIPCSFIIEGYKNYYKLDVKKYFKNRKNIQIYKCLDSSYKFFYPFFIAGNSDFYEQLQKIDWYYMDWKWENTIVRRLIKSTDKVLEIGCGKGAFITKLTENGIACCGLELNSKAAKKCRQAGLNVLEESIQEHSKNYKKTYDVVCSFQVVEHIANIKAALQSSVDVLNEGGKLFISVPNNDSFLGYDEYNFLNMPPHHMGLWGVESLTSLERIFKIKLKNIYIEPLQKYHYRYYISVKKNLRKVKYYWMGKYLNIINKPIDFMITRFFSRYITGFTILAEYIKE